MPLVALLPYVGKYFDRIIYFSSGKDIEKKLMNDGNVQIFTINPPALKRSLTPENLLIPFRLARSINECADILKQTHARLVFSKGGYCALPVCLAAAKLKIPYICHESDLSLGLANRLTYKNAAKLLTVFEETAIKYGGVYVGPPIKEDKKTTTFAARKKLCIKNSNKPLLLVTGGSQGSKIINDAVKNHLPHLLKKYDVLHLCGKGNMSGNISINGYYPREFADMNNCLAASDIVLSRGGSNTLFEIAYNKKPALVAPLKKGSRGDQLKNARYFYAKGASALCDENDLKNNITALIDELWKKRAMLKANLKKLDVKNGTAATAEEVLNLAKNLF